MLFYMAIFLTLVSAYIEIKLVKSFPWLHQVFLDGIRIPRIIGTVISFFTKEKREYKIPGDAINTAFSLGLSYVMGIMFGATGFSVMLAGLASTVATAKYYTAEAKVKASVESIRSAHNKYAQPIKDTVTVLKWIVLIISAPFRACRWALVHYHIARSWVINSFNTVKVKLTRA